MDPDCKRAALKARLMRIAGTAAVFSAIIILLAVTAPPDDGPAPQMRVIVMTSVLLSAPLLLFGMWLRRKSKLYSEQAESEQCVKELEE